jgi:glyoxylase-like metal-dependent hydrolase (beta-lactamase superfamily II)
MTPGHTAGSLSVLLAGGEAIVGDVLMGGFMGGTFRAGKPNLHYFAEDPGQVRRSLEFLLAQPVHTLHVGHGGPLAAEVVRAQAGRLLAQLDKLRSSGG